MQIWRAVRSTPFLVYMLRSACVLLSCVKFTSGDQYSLNGNSSSDCNPPSHLGLRWRVVVYINKWFKSCTAVCFLEKKKYLDKRTQRQQTSQLRLAFENMEKNDSKIGSRGSGDKKTQKLRCGKMRASKNNLASPSKDSSLMEWKVMLLQCGFKSG